ncbi:YkgJ family cysteine cluster protein [Candidatus Poribacteria bacterium]|nr:YkgJ family cysteine cluster protein [Candidatus Poribacteria bacterium]
MTNLIRKDDEITFLRRGSSFRFECEACGRCCSEYRIILSPYDILRLRRATGLSTAELRARGTIGIKRESFKKVFGFAPIADLFEVFGLPANDVVPIATLKFQKKERGKNVCEFLAPPRDGKRLCTIYADRPGMCRLHPLGCVTIANRRQWFFRQPLCAQPGKLGTSRRWRDGIVSPIFQGASSWCPGTEHTVSQWLRESGARPFLAANTRFLKWIQQLLGEYENLSSITEDHWKLLEQIWYDMDS